MKTLVSAISGAVLATALVLACSDDSPPSADAAVCDCPAAEPPINDRVTTTRGTSVPAPGPGTGLAIAMCPAGAKLLSGGCFVDEPTVNDITMRGFGKMDGQEGYECRWLNNHSQAQMVHAEATCLVPAQ